MRRLASDIAPRDHPVANLLLDGQIPQIDGCRLQVVRGRHERSEGNIQRVFWIETDREWISAREAHVRIFKTLDSRGRRGLDLIAEGRRDGCIQVLLRVRK